MNKTIGLIALVSTLVFTACSSMSKSDNSSRAPSSDQSVQLSLGEQAVIDYTAAQLANSSCPDFTERNPLFPARSAKSTLSAFYYFVKNPEHLGNLERSIQKIRPSATLKSVDSKDVDSRLIILGWAEYAKLSIDGKSIDLRIGTGEPEISCVTN